MSKRSEPKRSPASEAVKVEAEAKSQLDPELQALLREAQEALQEGDVPSGGWDVAADLPQGPVADPWPGTTSGITPGISLDGIDPETAFWLLFPPRGTA